MSSPITDLDEAIRLLQDRHGASELRYEAARFIGRSGSTDLAKQLRRALSDREWRVRRCASGQAEGLRNRMRAW